MRARMLQTVGDHGLNMLARIERWLEAERAQLPLWMPVALGCGIAAWFILPGRAQWTAFLLLATALALAGASLPWRTRFGRVVMAAGLLAAIGCALIWTRATWVASPVLARPAIVTLTGRVDRVEPLAARDLVRLTISPAANAGLPRRVRVNIAEKDVVAGIGRGAVVRLRARLMPPPDASVPGAYDFARVAWFAGIGATGRAFAPIEVVTAGEVAAGDLRRSLTAHIQGRVDGSEGGIAAALVTGDRGAIAEEDAEAMRRAGLAHLLSISGLHVTAVVAGTMVAVLKLLALFPGLALRVRLPVVAAGAGAVAAIGYTWLSGAEVPTVRSCIAALLVLAALSLGREAITLRLIATGAFLVLLVLPESLSGPSFQLSFAAVTAIVALHEHPRVRRWFLKRDENVGRRFLRELGSLLLTGLAVEFALMPIGLYHFHKAGLYGAVANIVAIPLTTFVTMPLEAAALALDLVGSGAPAWWAADRSLAALLWIARTTAAAPGSVASLPAMPDGAFAAIVLGAVWVALWRTRWRWLGIVPFAFGLAWALRTPAPDLLVTGDGRHLALRTANGGMAILRDRAGDYVRSTLGEGGGVEGDLPPLAVQDGVRCSEDVCLAQRFVGDRRWTILATRSGYAVPWTELVAACARADIGISDRRLPRACHPRWLKLDRAALRQTGGVAISLANASVTTVRGGGTHPWRVPPTVQPERDYRRGSVTPR